MFIANVSPDHKKIYGAVNGAPFSVTFSDEKFKAMEELIEKSETVSTMAEMKDLIDLFLPLTKESYKEIIETESPYLSVNKAKNEFYLKYGGEVSSQPLPKGLVDKIIQAVENGASIKPLIKFWARFLRNPNYNTRKAKLVFEYVTAEYTDQAKINDLMVNEGFSQEEARKQATGTQVAITREGLLVCYKVSKEIVDRYRVVDPEREEVMKLSAFGLDIDPITGFKKYKQAPDNESRIFEPAMQGQGGDAFHSVETGKKMDETTLGHTIRVGRVHALDSWDQVDTTDEVACRRGLHCGGLNYISGYQKDGTVTHNILVDPMHIGAVVGVGMGNDGALRVKQYFVLDAFGGVNKSLYHSSEYAKLSDQEYANMVEEAVKATSVEGEKIQKRLKERSALAEI